MPTAILPSFQAPASSLERSCDQDIADLAKDLKDTLGRMLAALADRDSGGGGGAGGGADPDAMVAAEALCTVMLNAVVRSRSPHASRPSAPGSRYALGTTAARRCCSDACVCISRKNSGAH